MQGSWNYIIDPAFFGIFSLLLSGLGIGALLWLIIWVENSQDMTMQTRLIGGVIRAILTAILLAWGLYFFILYQTITV